jgi:hypothetical protein
MKLHRFAVSATLALATAALVAACGGGGGDPPAPAPAPVVVQTAVLQGTAATGAALANAQVAIVDGSGAAACQEASIVTSGTGSFTCTLKAGETAPFFVSVTDPAGIVAPMVSVATQTPALGSALVVNATPLTTAILAQLAPDHNALTVFNAHAVDTAALAQTTTNVVSQLQPVLASIGLGAGYDPFTTSITAASPANAGNTADLVLDVVKVGSDNAGNITLATIDNPNGVAMASAGQAGAPLPAANASVASLSSALQSLASTLNQCFALPVAQRVLSVDTSIAEAQGGSEVTQAAAACENPFDDAFLQNGYRAGQLFYGLLTSSAMTSAQFSVAQVMQYLPKASNPFGYDAAIINIRYLDGAGNAGNNILVAVDKGTGSATHDWTLYGNQQPVEVIARAAIRLQQQQADVTRAPFNTTASFSTYQTGLEFFVNKDGPGSTGLTTARVSGPGLPATGLVLNRPIASSEPQQSWLNIADKFGGNPATVATQKTNCSCDIFWLQRTQDIVGAGATAIRNNPNGGNNNNVAFPYWAHPLDYGAALGTPSDQYVPFASILVGSQYKIELFYNNSATPTYTFSKTLLSPVIPATRGSFLAWNAPTPATLAILDPANPLGGAASSYTVAWSQNPSAEQIRLVQVFSASGATTVNQGDGISVAKGVTSIVVPAPSGLQFQPLDSNGTSSRSIQFLYRTFDNSQKLASYRYN